MQFNRNIYYYSWKRLVRWLIPQALRKPLLLAFAEAFVSGLQYVHAAFIDFKLATEYELTITGQVVYLEKMLNDRFDFIQRRIYIIDGIDYEPLWLALDIENKPQWLATDAEQKPLWLCLDSETGKFSGDFIIVIPPDVVFDEAELVARVNKYKLASKQWTLLIKN